MSNWQPAHVVDVVLRFDPDYGPALRATAEAALRSAHGPEEQCRELLRGLGRAVGVATHGYVWAAPAIPLQHVKLPVDADEGGTHIAARLYLNVPMTQPVNYADGHAIAGLLQALVGLPRGSLVRAELGFPAVAKMGEPAPLLTALNPATLPGQKLCPYCRNPMPDYEVECRSCGARAEG